MKHLEKVKLNCEYHQMTENTSQIACTVMELYLLFNYPKLNKHNANHLPAVLRDRMLCNMNETKEKLFIISIGCNHNLERMRMREGASSGVVSFRASSFNTIRDLDVNSSVSLFFVVVVVGIGFILFTFSFSNEIYRANHEQPQYNATNNALHTHTLLLLFSFILTNIDDKG